jgi:nitrite reductase (NADH) small subunit
MTAAETTTPYRLGPVEAIPLDEGRAFAIGDEQVAVFRLRDGTLRATQARCPHAGGPLADGQLDPARIVCPLHLREFAFADGSCPEGERLRVYPVREADGDIVIEI